MSKFRGVKPAAWLLAALLIAGCGGPKVLALDKDAPADALPTCKDCVDEKELRRSVRTDGQLAFVKRVNAIEYRLTGRPLSSGNRIELLLDGPDTHRAQLDAIRTARHHVHLITYIMTDDKLATEYLKALVERRKHGVTVRFMFDSVGGRTVSEEFRGKLAKAGIDVREFGPMNPMKKEDSSLTRRHHRKILVVDGKVAFTGGINISDEYRSSSSGSGSRSGGWRDTHVRIEGPGVAQFQAMFFESWALAGDPIKRNAQGNDKYYFPKLEREGDDLVRGVTQNGNDLQDIALKPVTDLAETEREQAAAQAIYGSYLGAMDNARKSIWITQAYFIPNDEFIEVITRAARRGVDVRVLVPSTSDIQMMVDASRFHYQPLLEAGARIYEYSGPMLHAKTAVVDGVWATVGSSNLDYRSFIHNDEANAIIVGAAFGEKMEKMFNDDIGNAREITRKAWEDRPWVERMRQRGAVLLEYWI